MGAPLEMERKFLIRMPDPACLSGAERWDIVQTYLNPKGDEGSRRVRRAACGDSVRFTHTAKTRLTAVTCVEEETTLTLPDYEACLREAREDSLPVAKTRYRIPHAGRILEIDIYPFWQDTAVLEVELASEDEALSLPAWVEVLREVTAEKLYKNTTIAKWLKKYPDTPLPI